MKNVKLGALSAAVATVSALPAYAFDFWSWSGFGSRHDSGGQTSSVPEIDASAGVFALAAVGVVLLLAIERRRRRA